mgnify:CR=1 FL=1
MAGSHLERLENDREITRKTDGEFLYAYQQGLLLSLLASGKLTQAQFCCADNALKQQRATYEKRLNTFAS